MIYPLLLPSRILIVPLLLRQTSLSASRRNTKTPIPVLFVHVPDLRPADKPYEQGDPVYTAEDVAEVLKRICWWVANGGA